MKVYFKILVLGSVFYELLLRGTLCSAQGVIQITFDGPPPEPFGVWTNYSEAGMVFTGRFARTGAGATALPQNDTAYIATGLGSSVKFTSIDFWSFDLVSVDLAEYSTVVPDAVTVRCVGYRKDGTVVTTNLTSDGIIDGAGPVPDFETFTFGPEFSGLTRVEIPTSGWSLDNLVLKVQESDRIVKFQPVAWGGSGYDTNSVIAPTLSNLVAVSAGGYFAGLLNVGLRPDGTVTSWGRNYFGLTNVPPGLSNVVAVSAGSVHSLALLADGTVRGWGAYFDSRTQTNPPAGLTNPPASLTGVVAIAAGGWFSLALRADGTVIQWPTNEVPDGLSNVVAIAAGENHCMALKSDGTVAGWGKDWSGVGMTNLQGSARSNFVAIAAGNRHSLALRKDGTIVGWGANIYGDASVPRELTNALAIAAGAYTSLALLRDGTVAAWGDNSNGQTNVPVGLSNVVAISVGYAHCLALVGDGPPVLQAPASAPKLSGGEFSLVLPTQSGRVYRLEYLDSLTQSNWTPLPLVAGNSQKLTFTDPLATNSQRFYRTPQW